MVERILVPTDGSETAASAMDAAVAMAERDDAEIHVLNVVNSRYYDTSIDSAVAPLRERGERYVAELADRAEAAGVAVVTTVDVGRPARAILAYAADEDVDLIVMGTTGRGDLQRRLLGSVTEFVVTYADVPVHVVPAVDGG